MKKSLCLECKKEEAMLICERYHHEFCDKCYDNGDKCPRCKPIKLGRLIKLGK